MQKRHNTKISGVFFGFISVFLTTSPASAQLLRTNPVSSTSALSTAVNSNSSATTSILGTSTQVVENAMQTTVGATLSNGLSATVEETTNTDVGAIAGASTDSQTTATVVSPDQIVPNLSSTINNPHNILQPEGQFSLEAEVNNQGAQVDTNADYSLGIGDLAEVNICLDGSATVGSPDGSSLANCPEANQPKEIPEPTTIGGLIVLGAYLFTRKK